MATEPSEVLFDTDVLLDVLLERRPFYQDSALAWSLAENNEIKGFACAITFTNIFYITQRLKNGREAKKIVKKIHRIFSTAPCNEKVMQKAINSDQSDFEDAVQYECGLEAELELLLTRNTSDYPRQGNIPVLTPKEFLSDFP